MKNSRTIAVRLSSYILKLAAAKHTQKHIDKAELGCYNYLPVSDYLARCGECQEGIAIKFVLFLTGFNFRRQTDFKVRADGIKVVQDMGNSILNSQVRHWN